MFETNPKQCFDTEINLLSDRGFVWAGAGLALKYKQFNIASYQWGRKTSPQTCCQKPGIENLTRVSHECKHVLDMWSKTWLHYNICVKSEGDHVNTT